MAHDAAYILGLADAILDGQPFDWAAAESSASHSQRALIRHLRTVAAIASFNLDGNAGAPAADTEPASWSHLHIVEAIGRGAFGVVYRAWDTHLDREIALKVLPVGGSNVNAALEEGRLLARIRHPNVVTIYGAERVSGAVGLRMEFVRGETLEALATRQGPLPINRVVTIGQQLCDALGAVHRAGLIHRDVKAHNVMVETDGRLVLMDFGTGRAIAGTTEGDLAGTPLYLAPEIFAGNEPSVQSDLYSVAVLLYYLLTGRYPVEGRSLKEVNASHKQRDAAVDVRLRRVDTPRRLAGAIERGLAQNPSARFATAQDMRAALTPQPAVLTDRAFHWFSVAAVLIGFVWITQQARVRHLPPFSRRPPAVSASAHPAPSVPTTRRLPLPQAMLAGSGLAFHGRYFSFATVDGAVSVFDLATSETKTVKKPAPDGIAGSSVMSPDGNRVAYEWWRTPETNELRVASRIGDDERVLLRDGRFDVAAPLEWSHDGSLLVAMLTDHDGTNHLGLIDVATGHNRIVRTFRGGFPLAVSLSADGRYVAYDFPVDAGSSRRDIRVATTDGDDDRSVFPATSVDNRFPLWTPDGQSIFFISDRSGSRDGWLVPMDHGNAAGDPSLVARNLDRVTSLGLVEDGSYYYRVQTGAFEVFEMSLDPATMAPIGKPHVVPTRFNGSNIGPSYSPDGTELAYISARDGLAVEHASHVLVIRDVHAGTEREIAAPLDIEVMPPMWSPDGQRLLVRATSPANHWGVFVVNAWTATIEKRLEWPAKDMTEYGWVCWSPDGRSIVYERAGRGIVAHRIHDDRETMLFEYSKHDAIQRVRRVFAFDHQGTRLAFSALLKSSGTALLVVDASGTGRELLRTTTPVVAAFQAWSATDRDLLFTQFAAGSRPPHELWRIPSLGGSARRLDISIPAATGTNPIAINPAASTIAYTSGAPSTELWMMQNFLPGK